MQIGGGKLNEAFSESGGSQRPASRVSSSVTMIRPEGRNQINDDISCA